jgi:hypothetical protein
MESIRARIPVLFFLVAVALIVALSVWFLVEPSQGALAGCGWRCHGPIPPP